MERNIKPCQSKSGKWKRLSRIKKLAGPYSHSNRRQVQRYRSCPLPNASFGVGKIEEDSTADVIQEFHSSQTIPLRTNVSSLEPNYIIKTTGLTTETPGTSCNLECIKSSELVQDEQVLNPDEDVPIIATEGPVVESDEDHNRLEVLGEVFAVPVKNNALQEKLLAFISTYRLSNVAANKLLRIIKCSEETEIRRLPKNLNSLETSVLAESPEFLLQWICSQPNCRRSLHVRTKPAHPNTQNVVCCGITYTPNDSHALYIQMRPLLRCILPKIWKYRAPEHMIQRMKERFEMLGLNATTDISITLNVDGVPASKSSNCSLWPILGYVDNLPAKISAKNILLFGVWVGHDSQSTKPDMNTLLNPIVTGINALTCEGVLWNLDSKTEITTKVVVSKVLCDSMGRPSVQKMQQLNGTYGCGYCFHKESNHYFKHIPLALARTNSEHRQLCDSHDFSQRNLELTKGVMGKSALLNFDYLDIINDLPPCFLHTLYLGVARTFTQLLLTDVSCPGRVGKDVLQSLTDNLLLIKPPHRVSRSPRSFSEMPHWKGHEWGMWLIFYSPILFRSALAKPYWHHWIHLVYGCSILLKSSRGVDEQTLKERISSAYDSLELFSRDVSRLYGSQACRFNVHLLRHLPKLATLWGGDILNTTMAPFETYNGVLQGFINNSQHMSHQIGRRYWRNIQITEEELPARKSSAFMGELIDYNPPEGIVLPKVDGDAVYYSRFCTSANKILYSEQYKRSSLRYSSWVKLYNNKIAEVVVFVKTDVGNYAIVKILTAIPFATLNYIFKITGSTGFVIIDIEEISEIVLRVDSQVERFACEFLNNVEHIRE